MRAKLKGIHIQNFKGFKDFEIVFDNDTSIITGRNGSGKTTIADAYFWVLADKDYSLKSNPEVHPDFMEESEPSVTLIFEVDGKEVTLRKFQKDSRNKKQKEEGAPVRISNQYEINSVPKSQKDFVAYLKEIGIDVDAVLLLSHPEIFTAQKSADCRKILFGMVSDITDRDIAVSMTGCEEVAELLDGYTVEEITAMKKREKKEADENIDAIPNQIIGLESAKVQIDKEEYLRQKETLDAEIQRIEAEIISNPIPSIGELNQKLVFLEKEEKQLTEEANADRVRKLTELDSEIGQMKTDLSAKMNELNFIKMKVADSLSEKTTLENNFESYRKEFESVKASEYDMGSTICPYCKQELPIHQVDEAKKHFEEDKQKKLNEINATAKVVQAKIKNLETNITDSHANMQNLDAEIQELNNRIEQKKTVREPLEKVVTVSNTEEQERIMKEIIAVRHQISERDSLVEAEDMRRNEIRHRQQAMREIDDVLAQEKNNERINMQIADLKQKQKEYAQAKANAEKILYQLSQISMAKNNALEEQVNSHFDIVKFKLFEQQKNGEYKDCCIPTIRNADGVYRVYGESANTALMIRAQLDIISGLQKFYDQHLPVFLDGAEALDAESKKQIHMDTQLIMMCVSENELIVEGI